MVMLSVVGIPLTKFYAKHGGAWCKHVNFHKASKNGAWLKPFVGRPWLGGPFRIRHYAKYARSF